MRVLLAALFVVVGCSREAAAPNIGPAPEPAASAAPVAKGEQIPADLMGRARYVASAFKRRDLAAVSLVAHPTKGVRFSPYAFVEKTDVVIPAGELVATLKDPTPKHFGSYDGSGDPIDMSFATYIDHFVYDVDFASAPKVSDTERLGGGNTIANHEKAYPGARFVEFHFDGFDKKYEGMDWRSLRLAFEQHDGEWRLVGVIHDQWTI